MRLIHISDIRAPHGKHGVTWAFGHARAVNTDLVICTGDIAVDPRERVYRTVAESIADNDVDAVFTPGERDDPAQFQAVFGRRYRIDSRYAFLDRLVRVGGVPLLLIDSAAPLLAEEQVLWLESQLHELHRAVIRGESSPEVLLFSYRSLLPMVDKTTQPAAIANATDIEEILASYRAGRHRLKFSVFSGGWSGRGPHEPAGLCRYGTPPLGVRDADMELASNRGDGAAGEPGAIRLISVSPGERLETVLVYPAGRADDGHRETRHNHDR